MDASAAENYFIRASQQSTGSGTCHILKKNYAFKKNGFVLLPYQNPQVKAIAPQYFTIDKTGDVSLPLPGDEPPPLTLQAATSRQEYIKRVNGLKEHIQQGNIYEINYCISFSAENVVIDPLVVFARLQSIAKAPYAGLLKLGDEFIISASPELFLEKKGDVIFTKPIKGTIRRGKDAAEDEELKNSLYTSLKERTENVMAVDVARNDLSRFAKKGSVQVNKLYNIETFETVHQMVSTVSCSIKENTSFETIIDDTFPMASMTGAPKLRAMQLIDEYENFQRNYYSGAMGLVDANKDYTLSVIIRSIFYNQATKRLSVCVGGAITYLCEAEKEYDECLLKARALLKALNATIG